MWMAEGIMMAGALWWWILRASLSARLTEGGMFMHIVIVDL
jgi:hypothetical protein